MNSHEIGKACLLEGEFQPFPLEAIPPRLRGFVAALAGVTGTDPAFAALTSLVTIAGCVGNRIAVQLKPGWTEPAVLWGALVGRSGSTKSAVFRLGTSPLHELEALAEHASIGQKVLRQKSGRRGVRRKSRKRKTRLVIQRVHSCSPELLIEQRVAVGDVSMAKLACVLEENPLGLLLVRDELDGWVGSLYRSGSSGRGGDRPHWLSMHDAGRITIDRKNREAPIIIARAAVSVLGSIQPGTLKRVFPRAERDSGLLARMLMVLPPERPALWTETVLPEELVTFWREFLQMLLEIPPAENDAGDPRPRLIPLSDEAKQLWIPWHDQHVQQLPEIADDDLAAHFAKLKGGCARIALLLACVEVAESGCSMPRIGANAMHRAIVITEWFKNEARRIYAVLSETPAQGDRRRLLEWIKRCGGSVSVRDLTHGVFRYRGRMDAARAALDSLRDDGFGRWVNPQAGPQGGRPSPYFSLNSTISITKTPPDGVENGGFGDGDDAEIVHNAPAIGAAEAIAKEPPAGIVPDNG